MEKRTPAGEGWEMLASPRLPTGVVGKAPPLSDEEWVMEERILAGEMFSFITGKCEEEEVVKVPSSDTGLGIRDPSLLQRPTIVYQSSFFSCRQKETQYLAAKRVKRLCHDLMPAAKCD